MLVAEEVNDYFASISSLASKVILDCDIVRQSCIRNGRWEGLTVEQQEELLDRFMIDQTNEINNPELPNCFPVLKINCGEKIVVDFEHDEGWTWTDEHSAPFSWKTKSQQDLTLADLDDHKEDVSKKNRFAKRPRSPDRSIWESPAAFDDRDKNEIEKMFERFGIRVSNSDDKLDEVEDVAGVQTEENDASYDVFISPSHHYNEHSKLLPDLTTSFDIQNLAFEDDPVFSSVLAVSERTMDRNSDVRQSQGAGSVGSAKGVKITDKVVKTTSDKKKHHVKETHSRTANASDGDVYKDVKQTSTPSSFGGQYAGIQQDIGIVSPVYSELVSDDEPKSRSHVILAESGESSTDNYFGSTYNGGAVDNLGLSASDLVPELSLSSVTEDSGKGSSLRKSGFDFLDDW